MCARAALEGMRHLRSTVLLLALVAPACALRVKGENAELAARIDGNAADLAAFGKWDEARQAKINARCAETRVGPAACKRRLSAYRETRDALRALLTKQILTLEAATEMLARSPEAEIGTRSAP